MSQLDIQGAFIDSFQSADEFTAPPPSLSPEFED